MINYHKTEIVHYSEDRSGQEDKMKNLRDFPSLQDAVDAAAENEVILIPAGEWHCGAARLKSGLTLRFEPGAVLIAPSELEDYLGSDILDGYPLDHYFIGADHAENITIEGDGRIELEGHHFWPDFDGAPWPRDDDFQRGANGFYKPVFHSAPYRPVGILLTNCRNVDLTGFTLRNAAAYTVWALGCEQVRIDRVTVENHRQGPNTDGFDIDCCRDVRISSCRLCTGDDAIALKSDISRLGRDMPCERIHLLGNTLSSTCCAVRIGYEGDGAIRDVIVSDNIIHDCNIGYDLLSVIPWRNGKRRGIDHGAKIENIIFGNTVMRAVRQPLKIWSGTDEPETVPAYRGYIRHIHFSNMEIDATDSSFIGGLDVSDISLDNIDFRIVRDPRVYQDAKPAAMTDVWGRGYLPDPLTVYHVGNLRSSNVRISESFIGEQ